MQRFNKSKERSQLKRKKHAHAQAAIALCQDETFSTNRLVLEQPRIVLENLTNLEQLPPTGTTLVIGILRLRGGSGSPAVVMALVPS